MQLENIHLLLRFVIVLAFAFNHVCIAAVKGKGESHVRFRTLGECPLEGHLS